MGGGARALSLTVIVFTQNARARDGGGGTKRAALRLLTTARLLYFLLLMLILRGRRVRVAARHARLLSEGSEVKPRVTWPARGYPCPCPCAPSART